MNTHDDGVLDKKTKEMIGIVANIVLLCDDCIKYRLRKSVELGITTAEMYKIYCSEHCWWNNRNTAYTPGREYWKKLHGNEI